MAYDEMVSGGKRFVNGIWASLQCRTCNHVIITYLYLSDDIDGDDISISDVCNIALV